MDIENFKRPDHPDFMLSSELRDTGFSGIRHNSLTDYMELWVTGEKKGELSVMDYQLNPEKWAELFEEVFACKHVEIINQKGN